MRSLPRPVKPDCTAGRVNFNCSSCILSCISESKCVKSYSCRPKKKKENNSYICTQETRKHKLHTHRHSICVWTAQVCLWEEITGGEAFQQPAASALRSLWPLALSLETTTALLPHSMCLCMCHCSALYSCLHFVCFPVHLTVLFHACFTHSWLTAFVYLLVCVYECAFTVRPSVCVLPFACQSPHLLVNSQQALHWAVSQHAAALPLNWTSLWG